MDDKTGNRTEIGRRFVRQRRPFQDVSERLVYTDGSCTRNGREDATGHSIVAYEPKLDAPVYLTTKRSLMDMAVTRSHTLPDQTLYGRLRYIRPSSNRAKLYATILALQACPWAKEGGKTLVVAGDLKYVVRGITEWVWRWRENGWIKSDGDRVKNVDLWELLLERILELYEQGVTVKFWKVPRVKSA
ncbi:unnamed protein product [Peniophora sp. CBMAI 1063]|nr:unnamed protein product [Peniophora sp. CBMAI 1063]